MRKDWGSIHILPTRESEAGYDPDSMHTKCSTCDVACQKIFQGTEKHQGYQWMSCFTLPSKGVCLCRNLWKRVMQAERYKHHFLQLATFLTLMRRLLLPAPVPNRIMCAKFCMKWRRRMETSLSGKLMKMVDRAMWRQMKMIQLLGKLVRGPLTQMCLSNTSCNSFLALYRSSMSQLWNPNLESWGAGQRYNKLKKLDYK